MIGYPLLLEPRYDEKIWGGRRLETVLDKSLPDEAPVGESLESGDDATVANGRWSGRSLGELVRLLPVALLGDLGRQASQPFGDFPLLAKFIDASETLSLQVHPDDTGARSLGKRGKTEAWYVVAAEPGAVLITGIVPKIDAEAVRQALADGTFESLLCHQPVQAGDVLVVPAGTVHAIGAGILLYEIQQNSDLTFRLYDWGRVDRDGQSRSLHLDEALAALRTGQIAGRVTPLPRDETTDVLAACSYFLLERWRIEGVRVAAPEPTSFRLLSCIAGAVALRAAGQSDVDLVRGRTVLLPADVPEITVVGSGTVLCSSIADLRSQVIDALLGAGHERSAIMALDGGTGDLERALDVAPLTHSS